MGAPARAPSRISNQASSSMRNSDEYGCYIHGEEYEPLEDHEAAIVAKRSLIISSKDFIAGFVPPDYLIDGILQRRFVYSLTAPTGGGKTALALLFSAFVALGQALGKHGVAKGRVLYLAGENPDDIRMRWIAMAEKVGFFVNAIDVHFIPGTFPIAKMMPRIKEEVASMGGVDLVVVDTSAAYFDGDQENDNVQMGTHARVLRSLTTLTGGPCVVVACHPTKHASDNNLLPRGGGAFIAEMDGNLVCLKRDSIVDLHWQGKFRGAEFESVGFELESVTSSLVDSKGRLIPTVMAKLLPESVREDIETRARRDQSQEQ
jgi:hypothetical protein